MRKQFLLSILFSLTLSLHGQSWSGVLSTTRASGGSPSCSLASTLDVRQLHAWEADWTPGSLVLKADGVQVCSITSVNVPSDLMMFRIMNNLYASQNAIDPSTLPQTLTMSYLKVTCVSGSMVNAADGNGLHSCPAGTVYTLFSNPTGPIW